MLLRVMISNDIVFTLDAKNGCKYDDSTRPVRRVVADPSQAVAPTFWPQCNGTVLRTSSSGNHSLRDTLT